MHVVIVFESQTLVGDEHSQEMVAIPSLFICNAFKKLSFLLVLTLMKSAGNPNRVLDRFSIVR